MVNILACLEILPFCWIQNIHRSTMKYIATRTFISHPSTGHIDLERMMTLEICPTFASFTFATSGSHVSFSACAWQRHCSDHTPCPAPHCRKTGAGITCCPVPRPPSTRPITLHSLVGVSTPSSLTPSLLPPPPPPPPPQLVRSTVCSTCLVTMGLTPALTTGMPATMLGPRTSSLRSEPQLPLLLLLLLLLPLLLLLLSPTLSVPSPH